MNDFLLLFEYEVEISRILPLVSHNTSSKGCILAGKPAILDFTSSYNQTLKKIFKKGPRKNTAQTLKYQLQKGVCRHLVTQLHKMVLRKKNILKEKLPYWGTILKIHIYMNSKNSG